jgi:nucleoid-associated protein YgaU
MNPAESELKPSELKPIEVLNKSDSNSIVKEQPVLVDDDKPSTLEEQSLEIKEQPLKVEGPKKSAIQIYKVQKGETLMQIAFKLYGDISRWKELKKMNGDKLAANKSLKTKTALKYIPPAEKFIWNPEGKAYLIKNGENLCNISTNVYKTSRKWKKIWENNKPLITNPNRIYAGFTIYYKPKSTLTIKTIDEEIDNIQSATYKK